MTTHPLPEEIWTTKDGRKIPIVDMSNEHLLNTISMLRRKGKSIRQATEIVVCKMLTFLQGEMAIESVESELHRLENSSDDDLVAAECEQFEPMLAEAERRGIL